MSTKLSVVIPVYKKTDMFVQNLQHNVALFPKNTEIIIVDDASQEYLSEKIESLLKKKNVHLIENDKNVGFSRTINKGIKIAQGAYILLLNSDVRLLSTFPENYEDFFRENSDIAAVSFAEKNHDSVLGKSTILFSRGLVVHSRAHDNNEGLTAWASGGSCLFRADRLKSLGAFDEIYSPFYWEDIDLSFRAYSRGWKINFIPSYKVEHMRESTISTFYSSSKIKHIAFRNQFLFMWSNITDLNLTLQHIFWLPINLLLMSIKGETEFISGFFSAMRYISTVMKRRAHKLRYQKISDAEIFSLFS